MLCSELKNKQIAIWGYGVEGKATLDYLCARLNQSITVLAKKEDHPVSSQYSQNIVFDATEVTTEVLNRYDVVIKSPGISIYQAIIQQAQQQGTIFTSASAIWFAENKDAKTVCITGSKGKSTTANVCAELMKAAGFNVALAGNIGNPLLAINTKGVDYWVIELSSYQCVDFAGCPTVAVLLNLFPEHLDWHRSIDHYYRDKRRIFANMNESSIGIINANDSAIQELLLDHENKEISWQTFADKQHWHVEADGIYFAQQKKIDANDIKLPGKHNWLNICAAITAISALGIKVENHFSVLNKLTGLPHRIQWLGSKNNIDFIDDSLSTTPYATVAALESIKNEKAPICVLVGGYDRGLDWSVFVDYVDQHQDIFVIGMNNHGKNIIQALCQHSNFESNAYAVDSMEKAVILARKLLMQTGGAVLLSPGAPSYGVYKNYQARGIHFKQLSNL